MNSVDTSALLESRDIDALKERASKGDCAAAIALGQVYFKGGLGVSKDYDAARNWWQQVKPEYDATGFVANRLATIYYKGLGVPRDRKKAYRYLRSAAVHGHRKSLVLLAILNKQGYGTVCKPRTSRTILCSSAANDKLSLATRFLALLWLV